MNLILERDDIQFSAKPRVDASRWTLIIPAAGRGTRLKSNAPKFLYLIAGQPILHHLLTSFSSLVSNIVVVVSESAIALAKEALASKQMQTRATIAIQESPKGMAHAVLCAKQHVTTENVLIIWGDQVTARERTARLCMSAHDSRPNALLTLPTYMRSNPYIHLERNDSGRIVRVLQKREGEIDVPAGENDCGMFLFNAARLFSVISGHMEQSYATGAHTGELNLLPLLPLFDDGAGSAQTLRIAEESETLGVNTVEDAARAEAILALYRQDNNDD